MVYMGLPSTDKMYNICHSNLETKAKLALVMLQSEQYKKLAEFILLKVERGTQMIFDSMGELRNMIER